MRICGGLAEPGARMESAPMQVRSMLWRVLNLSSTSAAPNAIDMLKSVADVVTIPPGEDVIAESVAGYDALITSLTVRVTRSMMGYGSRLKVVASPTTGLDHIDLAAARELGIDILSLKNERAFLDSVTATAELTWALLLASVRKLPWAFDAASYGRWTRDLFRGNQLSGKVLGILGYGRLGSMVADYGKAFRMEVIAHDRSGIPDAPGVRSVDLDTLLRESDVLSIHIHLEECNHGLIGSTELSKMKTGAVLINTSRGAIIDEAALLDALESGKLAAAGLDVIDGEWCADLSSHALLAYARRHDNLVVTPHIGGVTWESQRAALEHTVCMLKTYIEKHNSQSGKIDR